MQGSYDFRDVTPRDAVIAWILSFRRKSDKKLILSVSCCVAGGLQTAAIAFLQDWNKHFLRGAGIGRAFKHHQLTGTEMRRYCPGGVGNKTEIWLSIFVQRRGHTDDDGIHFSQAREFCGRTETLRACRLNLCRWNSTNVGSTRGESCDLTLVDVKTRYPKLRLGVEQSQRKAHVTETDHAYARLACFNSGFQL